MRNSGIVRWKALAAGEIDRDTLKDRVLQNGALFEALDEWSMEGGVHYIFPAPAFDKFAKDFKLLLGWLLRIREKGEQLGNLDMRNIDRMQEAAAQIGIKAVPLRGN